jgi:four helix bundle protein
MKYERFEDLPVWKAAMDFAVRSFELMEDRSFPSCGDVKDQLQRAGLSISNNIAEGFERGSTAELLMFLYIARGSAGECRSILRFCERLPRYDHLKSQISDLISLAMSISRQLRGWADSLQNSEIKRQRHLNDQSRANYEQARRADAFMTKLREIRERGLNPEKHLPKEDDAI